MRITQGQGEYIVYHKNSQQLEKPLFERVFKIMNDYSPQAMVQRGEAAAASHRYGLLRNRVQEIDPTLEVAFIPRTLYELVFIRQVMEESLKSGKLCSNTKNENCWHLCHFEDKGTNSHEGVVELAFRMNTLLLQMLNGEAGLTQDQVHLLADKELSFLHEEYKKANGTLTSCSKPDPVTNFRTESTRGSIAPMGIRDDEDKNIVKLAIQLECSERAQGNFLFFRGGDSKMVGPSLFSGSIYDGRASPFLDMRMKQKAAYALTLPFTEIKRDSLPQNHTIVQLCSDSSPIEIQDTVDTILLKKGSPSEEEHLKDLLAQIKTKNKK